MTETPDIRKGLAGVVVDTTSISKVNAETNSLLYRGYPVQELAAKCTFEEVAYLLWHGELPTPKQLAEFETLERSLRHLQPVVKRVIDELPLTAHPMDVVRTAVSVIGASDPDAADSSPASNLDKSIRLYAQLPAIVAYDQRRRRGLHLVEPRDDLSYSANFLFMTFDELPDVVVASAFRSSFGEDYGLTLTDSVMRGLLARTVIVAGADGVVRHVQITESTSDEPDYDAAVAALS